MEGPKNISGKVHKFQFSAIFRGIKNIFLKHLKDIEPMERA